MLWKKGKIALKFATITFIHESLQPQCNATLDLQTLKDTLGYFIEEEPIVKEI